MVRCKARRAQGRKVRRKWLIAQAKIIQRELKELAEQTGDIAHKELKFSRGWITRFLRRHSWTLRRRTNNKKQSAEERLPWVLWTLWHARRLAMTEPAKGSTRCPVYGRFTPQQTWGADSVPLEDDDKDGKTYEERGATDVHVRSHNPSNTGVVRFGTMHVLIRASVPQPRKIAMILFGTGKRISDKEKAKYHVDVDVYWQPNAWADLKFQLEFAGRTLKFSVRDTGVPGEHVCWLDNLNSQKDPKNQEASSRAGVLTEFLQPEITDIVQEVDDPLVGNLMKHFVNVQR